MSISHSAAAISQRPEGRPAEQAPGSGSNLQGCRHSTREEAFGYSSDEKQQQSKSVEKSTHSLACGGRQGRGVVCARRLHMHRERLHVSICVSAQMYLCLSMDD